MRRTCALLLLSISAGCVMPGNPVTPFGRPTSVYMNAGARLDGELLAVSQDSLWLYQNSRVAAVSSMSVTHVNVARHPFDARRTFKWMGIVGLGTGVALATSCAIYESGSSGGGEPGSCVLFVPLSLIFFGLGGALFSLSTDYSSKEHLIARDVERLRPYARFPQGLPDSVRRTWPRSVPQ